MFQIFWSHFLSVYQSQILRLKVRNILERKWWMGKAPLRAIFYSLMPWSWHFIDFYCTVLCLHSKRKILIRSTIGRSIPNRRKKICCRKSSSSHKMFQIFPFPLWKSVCITLKNSNFFFDQRASLKWHIPTKL